MKNILIIILLLTAYSQSCFGQNSYDRINKYGLFNVGINGLVAGVGALINRKDNQKKFEAFSKGFVKGSIGGVIEVVGSEMTYKIGQKNSLGYAWASRLTSSIGNSITYNAALNNKWWENWYFNLGVLRLEYKFKENKFKTRIFVSSLYGVSISGSQAKFDLKKSLASGILIFRKNGSLSAFGRNTNGFGFVSSISYNQNIGEQEFYDLIAHETMHIIQYDNLVWFNPLIAKINNNLKNNSKAINSISKFVYFDLNGLGLFGMYGLEINQSWECRFLEREAEYYSLNKKYRKCN